MIIGAAFTALVNSVVSNLFMPIISLFTGGIDFSNLYLPLNAGSKDAFMAGADINTARAAGSCIAIRYIHYRLDPILDLGIRCILDGSRIS